MSRLVRRHTSLGLVTIPGLVAFFKDMNELLLRPASGVESPSVLMGEEATKLHRPRLHLLTPFVHRRRSLMSILNTSNFNT